MRNEVVVGKGVHPWAGTPDYKSLSASCSANNISTEWDERSPGPAGCQLSYTLAEDEDEAAEDEDEALGGDPKDGLDGGPA